MSELYCQASYSSRKPISCDQVDWIMDALKRYRGAVLASAPSIARLDACGRVAALLEIMEIFGFRFADNVAIQTAYAHIPELREIISEDGEVYSGKE